MVGAAEPRHVAASWCRPCRRRDGHHRYPDVASAHPDGHQSTETPPPATVPPVAPDVAARTFVYRVAGVKGLLDVVTVVYTDATGAPQTDFNVALPWSRTVVLDPGVSTRSVVATSLTGRLNCSIADGVGQNIAISTSSTMIATCSR